MKRGIRKGGLFAVLALVAVLGLSAAAAAAIPSQGVCYNVRNSKLYDKNNVAPAINETVAKMKDGDRLYLQSGNYRFKETIKLAKDKDRLKNCTIVLEGVYTMDGSFDAMLIDGDFLNVEIGTVTSGRTSDDYKTQGKLPGGIKFRQTDYSDFTFGTVSGFDYGLRFSPQKTKTGECYNKFRFGAITHCYAGLNLNTEGTDTGDKSPAWVNENAFYGGKIANVTYGVLAKKGKNQIDEYNNNSFWNYSVRKGHKRCDFLRIQRVQQLHKTGFQRNWRLLFESESLLQGQYVHDRGQNLYKQASLLLKRRHRQSSSDRRLRCRGGLGIDHHQPEIRRQREKRLYSDQQKRHDGWPWNHQFAAEYRDGKCLLRVGRGDAENRRQRLV